MVVQMLRGCRELQLAVQCLLEHGDTGVRLYVEGQEILLRRIWQIRSGDGEGELPEALVSGALVL